MWGECCEGQQARVGTAYTEFGGIWIASQKQAGLYDMQMDNNDFQCLVSQPQLQRYS